MHQGLDTRQWRETFDMFQLSVSVGMVHLQAGPTILPSDLLEAAATFRTTRRRSAHPITRPVQAWTLLRPNVTSAPMQRGRPPVSSFQFGNRAKLPSNGPKRPGWQDPSPGGARRTPPSPRQGKHAFRTPGTRAGTHDAMPLGALSRSRQRSEDYPLASQGQLPRNTKQNTLPTA